MNVFSYGLERSTVDTEPELNPTKFVVDDNIGESIHIHYRNTRLEMSVDDFDKFCKNTDEALGKLKNGDC